MKPDATLARYHCGDRAACVVDAQWPERVSGLVSCGTGYNIQKSAEVLKPIEPEKEHLHWYWFYLDSERGRLALGQNRATLCRTQAPEGGSYHCGMSYEELVGCDR